MIHRRIVELGAAESRQALENDAQDVLAELGDQPRMPTADEDDPVAAAEDNVTLNESLIDSPFSAGAVAPSGYEVSMEGVVNSGRVILSTPLGITRRLIARDGTLHLEFTWWQDDQWHTWVCDAETLAKGRITGLANQGVPLMSDTIREVVKYCEQFRDINEDRIPRARMTDQLGWVDGDCEHGYMCGRTHITGPGSDDRPSTGSQQFVLSGLRPGNEQIANSIRSTGSLDI